MSCEQHYNGRFNCYRRSGRARKYARPSYSAFNFASRQKQIFENIGIVARNNGPPYRIRNSVRRKHFNPIADNEFFSRGASQRVNRNVGMNDEFEPKPKPFRNPTFRNSKLPYIPQSKLRNKNEYFHYDNYKGPHSSYANSLSDVKKAFLPSLNIKFNRVARRKISPNHLFPFDDQYGSEYCHSNNRNQGDWRTFSRRQSRDWHSRNNVDVSTYCEESYYLSTNSEVKHNQFRKSFFTTDDRENKIYTHYDHQEYDDFHNYDDDPFVDRSIIPGLQPRQSTNKRINDWLRANEKAQNKS